MRKYLLSLKIKLTHMDIVVHYNSMIQQNKTLKTIWIISIFHICQTCLLYLQFNAIKYEIW